MNQLRISQLWTWFAGAPLPFVLGAGGTVSCVPRPEALSCCKAFGLCAWHTLNPDIHVADPLQVSAEVPVHSEACFDHPVQNPSPPQPPNSAPFYGALSPRTLFPRGFIAVWHVTYLIVLLIAVPFLSRWALGNMGGLQGLGCAYLVWEVCQVLWGLWVERKDICSPTTFPFQPLGSFSEEK